MRGKLNLLTERRINGPKRKKRRTEGIAVLKKKLSVSGRGGVSRTLPERQNRKDSACP